jgi:mannose/fructose/N-acetylgalactosamine-specific phosphotransferase system component IIC
MKTTYTGNNLKDNVVSAALIGAMFVATIAAAIASFEVRATEPVAMETQVLDTIVVTAPRIKLERVDTIVVTAKR